VREQTARIECVWRIRRDRDDVARDAVIATLELEVTVERQRYLDGVMRMGLVESGALSIG
jgi:hypothetical protein